MVSAEVSLIRDVNFTSLFQSDLYLLSSILCSANFIDEGFTRNLVFVIANHYNIDIKVRSYLRCFIIKDVHKAFAIFTWKHLQACNFVRKRLQYRCFIVNIAKFLKTPILKNICGRLLLKRRTLMSETNFGNWKPFKNDEKCFLFHLKSSFRSQDI